jgi:hypothetical protein
MAMRLLPPQNHRSALRSRNFNEFCPLKTLINIRRDQTVNQPKIQQIIGALVVTHAIILF